MQIRSQSHWGSLAIFDLDRTLTKRATWSRFLLFSARRNAPWRMALVPVVILMMLVYKARLISRKRLKELMQSIMLGQRLPQGSANHLAEAYADHCLNSNIYADGLAIIAAERVRGSRVVIASAAHNFYLAAIARRLGVDYIGTRSVWQDDQLSAHIEGENCYGSAKRDCIARFLGEQGIDRTQTHIRFYSDDISDVPTFEWADEAIAVNPSARLARHAAFAGWCIFDWHAADQRRAAA
jgi:HAD superfamily hydrolase (TIGR01490 family)